MARHSKKNLKKRGTRVSFKQKHPLRSVSSYNPIRKEWSGKRTVHENYRILGLISNANTIPVDSGDTGTSKLTLTELTTKRERKKTTSDKETFADAFADHDSERALSGYRLTSERRPAFWMSDEDVRYMEPLVARYGREYAKMFKDLKLNPLQKTKAWLKKKAVRLDNFKKSKSAPTA